MLNEREQDEDMSLSQISQRTQHSRFIICVLIIFYIIVLGLFFLLLATSRKFRYQLYDLIHQNAYDDSESYAFIILMQYLLIICGFDIFILDIMFGYLCHPFWHIFLVIYLTKIAGRYSCFLVARYLCRNKIQSILEPNLYYRVLEVAAESRPYTVIGLMQIIALPTIFKTYMVGLFQITHFQFLSINSIWHFLWTAFWINIGAQSKSLKQYLDDGDTTEIISQWVQITILISGIITFIILFNITSNVYKKMEHEYKLQN